MRRKDREMDRAFALEIIDEAAYGVMALAKDDLPYGLPLSLVRDGDRLLFHTARAGHKLEWVTDGAAAWVVFVSRVRVPDLFEEFQLEAMLADPEQTGQLVSSVFTTEFASAMVGGTITEVSDDSEKKRALERICQKYTPDKMKYFEAAAASGMALTRVFALSMEQVSAKRKKYDQAGQEMKFGRRDE